ncbi:MAG TPA: hypothetical protein VGG69_01875 [Rhizomicrobium sp.]
MDFSGNVNASYSNLSARGGDSSVWGGVARGNLTAMDPGINVQAKAGGDWINLPKSGGSNTNLWDFGGDVYWRDWAGDFGGSVEEVRLPDAHASSLSYGLFGEAYLLRSLTFRAKGGKLTNDVNAWYGSAGLLAYPVRNIALGAGFDYAKVQHGGPTLKDANVSAEYLPVPTIPVSVSLGYNYEKVGDASGHIDVLSAGITMYLGGAGVDGSLRDRQRNGAVTWDGAPASLVGLTF